MVGTLFCDANKIPYFSFLEFFRGSFVYIELLYIIGFFATHYFATFSNSSKISRLSKQRIEKKGGEGGGRCRNILLMQQRIEKIIR